MRKFDSFEFRILELLVVSMGYRMLQMTAIPLFEINCNCTGSAFIALSSRHSRITGLQTMVMAGTILQVNYSHLFV
jgi:hypothetical protein